MIPRAIPLILLLTPMLTAPAVGQQLRRGVADATRVVIAKSTGVQPLGNDLLVYRYETVETLKGEHVDRFSILVRKQVADQPRPTPTAVRVLCLRPEGREDLPERDAPWFRMTGYAGDDPVVDDSPESRSNVDLVRTLAASEGGTSPGQTADALARIALRGRGTASAEAVESLRERPVLRDALSTIARERLVLRAVGEVDDVPLKIALASLCAECGTQDLVPALALSLDQVEDPRFGAALGRIARHVHGEEATQVIQPLIARARGGRRDRLLLTLGATRTESALEALLKMHEQAADDEAVVAALRQHGAPRALDAIEPDEQTR